jgi:hypothetical protein
MNERPMKNIFENTFPYLLKNMHLLGYSLLSGVGLLTPFAAQTPEEEKLPVTSGDVHHICAYWARIGGLEMNIPKELGQQIKEIAWGKALPSLVLNAGESQWLAELDAPRLPVRVKEYCIALEEERPCLYVRTTLIINARGRQEEAKILYFRISGGIGDKRCIAEKNYQGKKEGEGLQVSARSVSPPEELVFNIYSCPASRWVDEADIPSGCYRSSVYEEWRPLCIRNGTRHNYVFYRGEVDHALYPPTNALETEEPQGRLAAALSGGLSLLQVAVVGVGIGVGFMAYRWTKK